MWSEASQFFFSGLSIGCIFAAVALGLVIVAKVTGVFNFATGEYVMLGGFVTAVTTGAGWGLGFAVLVSTVGVGVLAVAQERITVAPVRGKVGTLGLVIASLGVGVFIRGMTLLIWGEDPRRAPGFEEGAFHFLGANLSNQVKWIYLVTAVALLVVTFLFTRTDVGRAMRASAINPTATRLFGIRLGTTSMAAFAIAGLLCGLIGSVSASIQLVRWDAGISIGLIGFIAAALAKFDSPVKAVLAGLGLGLVESFSAGWISSQYREAIVYGVLVVYLLGRDFYGEEGLTSRWLKGRRASAAGSEDAPDLRAGVRERLHQVEETVRERGAEVGGGAAGVLTRARSSFKPAMLVPPIVLFILWFYPETTSDLIALETAALIVLAAISATGLGLIMGLAGQFSLGQAGFMLISGYSAALLTAERGWDPLVALVAAVALAIVIGAIVGWLTLRLEGINLALATLALLVIAVVFAERQTSLTHGTLGVNGVSPLKIFGNTIEEPDSFYRFGLVVLAIVLLISRNIWKSRAGRSLRAIGIDQEAAESTGLNAWSLKLRVFVLGAAMAGVAGVFWTYFLQFASPEVWGVALTIDLVVYVIVGGVTSPYGGAVGAFVVGALQYWIRTDLAAGAGSNASTWEIISTGALLVIFILFFRRGLASFPTMIAERVRAMRGQGGDTAAEDAAASASEEVSAEDIEQLGLGAAANGSATRSETPIVAVEGLTKQFGNLIVVNGVTFTLRPGYITAMIGPNGAGKSTIINMLSGTLLPSDGAVGIMGQPAVGLNQQQIARLGLARTFQTPRLFEGMTLLETVMLSRDRYGSRSWLFGPALRTPRSFRDEADSREQATSWIKLVGLAADADVLATSLTTGKQRLAEVARALATEPAVLLLDEPAAGLDGTETKALAEIVRRVAAAGIAVLLVEHDMSMVMSVADHVIVLEEGKKIAEGGPGDVANDKAVIDAYLGVPAG